MRRALLLGLLLLPAPAAGALVGTGPAELEPMPLARLMDPLLVPQHAPAPGPAADVGPGSHLFIEMEGATYSCTANYLWRGSNGRTYLGAAGHCFVPPGRVATHGPGVDWDRLDSKVSVCVSSCLTGGEIGFLVTGQVVDLGPVAYARRARDGVVLGHDFGIVEVPASLLDDLRPSLPVWGGPTSPQGARASGPVCMYGNGMGVAETFLTMARAGFGAGSFEDGTWQAALPTQVGDSGAAVVTCSEHAGGLHGERSIGLLTHGVGAAGVSVPGIALGTTTERAILMTQMDAGISIQIIPGA